MQTKTRKRRSSLRDNRSKVWFPAKKRGWGWGLPRVWQGWAVLLAYLGLVIFGLNALSNSLVWALLYLIALSLILIGVCWLKGDEPRWRW